MQIGFASYPSNNLLSFCLSLAVTLGQNPYFSENKQIFLCISLTFIINLKKNNYLASECQKCIHFPIEIDVFD